MSAFKKLAKSIVGRAVKTCNNYGFEHIPAHLVVKNYKEREIVSTTYSVVTENGYKDLITTYYK